jgi:cell division protein ZapA
MAQVQVTVNGRNYSVVCDDGEEAHLTELAQYVDNQVGELAASVGQIGEGRLMLMAGLLITDELTEAKEQISALENDLAAARSGASDELKELASTATGAMTAAAQKIEDIAVQLENA